MKTTLKSAFTLLEIVLVIVILGIVSMISANIIAHMYDGYIRTKMVTQLEQETELALELITKRLQYRIKSSVVARDRNNNDVKPLSASDLNESYTMLEWIGFDYEGFLGESNGSTPVVLLPGWSGFVDLYRSDSNKTQIVTPGSHLSLAKNSIDALSYGVVDISAPVSGDGPAVVFKCWNDLEPKMYGWDYSVSDHNNTLRVKSVGEDILEFTEDLGSKELCEQYYFAWSAYALVAEGDVENDFNLTFYYNYQPWEGDKYSDSATKKVILAEHVSTFRFMQVGSTVRIKLCIQDGDASTQSMGICKEKAVF